MERGRREALIETLRERAMLRSRVPRNRKVEALRFLQVYRHEDVVAFDRNGSPLRRGDTVQHDGLGEMEVTDFAAWSHKPLPGLVITRRSISSVCMTLSSQVEKVTDDGEAEAIQEYEEELAAQALEEAD